MTALVTKHLPLVAGAPDGIEKLRGLILDLAIQGKLVAQDANEETSSKLLAQIDSVKGDFLRKSELARFSSLAGDTTDICKYTLPKTWSWRRLGALGLVGSSSRVHQKDWQTSGVPFYRTREIVQLARNGAVDPELFISEDLYLELTSSGPVPVEGDIMITGVGTIGVPYIVREGERFYFKDASVLIFKNYFRLNSEYLALVFSSPYWDQLIHQESMGTTVHTLTIGRASAIPIPLPPLAEQHRIVAKVDELMALCDRLEADQADAEAAHAQLVQALLGSLTQATDAADFRASWQRLSEHFHTLFTTEASIDALKQTVLQLAVKGRLVDHELAGSETTEVLPPGWTKQLIGDFCSVQGGIQKTPLRRPVSLHFPYLRVANVQRGYIDVAELERYELTHDELAKWRLNSGDLLIVEGNGSENEIGRCAIWQGQVEDCVYQNHLMRVRPKVDEHVHYLALYLNSPEGVGHMKRLAITTSGLFNLSVGKIRSIPVPLPPLGEQHRIVAKVDELRALCDQLKAGLAEARQLHGQLATALVEQAVA